ncbi:putative tRNA pseudouridine synthase C16C4.06c [Schizosaccharomyces pombe]
MHSLLRPSRFSANQSVLCLLQRHRVFFSSISVKPRKRMVYCVVSYRGTGFAGLQYNANVKTIQDTLFQAFARVGAVAQVNADSPKKIRMCSAARTDKGVHAIVNVLGLKVLDNQPLPHVVNLVNDILPPCIRVWKMARTFNSFSPHTVCDSRVYEYWLPVSSLLTPHPCTLEAYVIAKASEKAFPINETLSHLANLSKQDCVANSMSQPFRLSKTKLDFLKHACTMFRGTHRFHSYTTEKGFSDASSRRFLLDVRVDNLHIDKLNRQWVKLIFHGQSFMKHQIRKMVGILIHLTRTGWNAQVLLNTFNNSYRIRIPRAPAEFLLLNQPIFQAFNKKCSRFDHEPVEWSCAQKSIDQFAHSFLRTPMFDCFISSESFQSFFILQKQFQLFQDLALLTSFDFLEPSSRRDILGEK